MKDFDTDCIKTIPQPKILRTKVYKKNKSELMWQS